LFLKIGASGVSIDPARGLKDLDSKDRVRKTTA
jgi:hypothetical protein